MKGSVTRRLERGCTRTCGLCDSLSSVEPYVRAILELFGPERTMWGSDWPVLELAAGYGEWLSLAQAHVPAAAREQVFESTAARFYGLEAAQ